MSTTRRSLHLRRTLGAAITCAALVLGIAVAAADSVPVDGEGRPLAPGELPLKPDGTTRRSSHDHYKAPELGTLGGAFELSDHNGRVVTDRTFRGKWLLTFVGYMSCQDVCPVALQTMAIAYDELAPEKARNLQLAFMDFDDERADAAKLAAFVGQFHPGILGLSGTRKQTWAVLRAFKVRRDHGGRYYPVPTEVARTSGDTSKSTLRLTSGDGRINHTSRMYLIGPDGKVKAYYDHDVAPTALARAVLEHMARQD